jgi:hypothetical protein
MIGGFIGHPIGGTPTAAITFALPVTTGAYQLGGQAAPLRVAEVIASGAYLSSGASATLDARALAASGAYALTGLSATLRPTLIVTSGAYVLGGQAVTLPLRFTVASGAYALTGSSEALGLGEAVATGFHAISSVAVAFALKMPALAGSYVLVAADAPLRLTALGAGGATPRLRGVALRLAERKITVTARDGTTRRVSYAKRFRPPPPLEAVPDWVLPLPVGRISAERVIRRNANETGGLRHSASQTRVNALLANPPYELPPAQRDLAALQDESDLLDALANMPDPLIENIATLVAAVGR